MKLRIHLRTKFCFLLAVLLLLSSGCHGVTEPVGSTTNSIEQSLNKSRPDAATMTPDFSGNITDIRITTVERPLEFLDNSGKKDENLSNFKFLQIYYGYKSDGIWHDIPRENYDLKGLIYARNKEKTGFDVAEKPHVVQIGQYVVICLFYNTGLLEYTAEISDSLGTQPLTMFDEYQTTVQEPGEMQYGYLKERCSPDGKLLGYGYYTQFITHYFMIVDYDDIKDDYALTFTVQYTQESCIETTEKVTLTAKDIWEALDA